MNAADAVLAPVTVIRKVRSRQVSVIEIEIPDEHHKAATAAFDGETVLITVAPESLKSSSYGVIRAGEAPDAPPAPGQRPAPSLARELDASGYWRNPALWDALAGAGHIDAEVHARQIAAAGCMAALYPAKFWSHFPGAKPGPCSGDVCAHHVRDAANAGVGAKPSDWFVVGLCAAHHVPVVHDHGSRVGRQWLLEVAVCQAAASARVAAKRVMKRESMAGVTQEEIDAFEHDIGLRERAYA